MKNENIIDNKNIRHSVEMSAQGLEEYKDFRTRSYKNGITVKFALKLGILNYLKIEANGTNDVYKELKIYCSEKNISMRNVIKDILKKYEFKKN